MQLLRLQLTNFRQHEATDLHFTAGLTGIIGANGSGKSTLVEAIGYALYGVPAVRGKRESLRRRQAPLRARVEVVLEFALGGRHHRIVRGQTQAELAIEGRTVATSTAAVTARVAHLLGMDRAEFFNTYFTGQKDLAVMASMGPADRARFLSQVLGYEQLRAAQDRLRERRSARRAELSGVEQGMADPAVVAQEVQSAQEALALARQSQATTMAAEEAAQAAVVALEPVWHDAVSRRTAWESLDGERRLLEQGVARTRAAFEAIDRQLAAALQAVARLHEIAPQRREWEALTLEREQLDQLAAAWTAWSEARARRDEAIRRAQALEHELTTLPLPAAAAVLTAERAAVVRARQEAQAQMEERRTRWTQDRQESDTRLAQSREQYRDLKEQRDRVQAEGAQGICPMCGRPLGDGAEATLALLTRQLEELAINGQYLRQRHDQLRTPPPELPALEDQLAQCDRDLRRLTESQGQVLAQLQRRQVVEADLQSLAEVMASTPEVPAGVDQYDQGRHTVVRSALAALEPIRRQSAQWEGEAARAEALGQEVALAEEAATAAEEALAALDQRLAVLAWDPERFRQLDQDRQAAQQARAQRQQERAAADAEVAGAERLLDTVRTRQQDLATRLTRLRQLSEELAVLDELDRTYADLRHTLNLQVRPELAERGSRLLRHLSQGRYDDLELDEQYVPVIVDDGEVQPVLSGGEEDIVNLALRLAISQMIADRAGQPLSLLVLDEIFGSLDDERRSGVLTLLASLADRFPQVILITHVESMREAFDRVLRVEYDTERSIAVVREEQAEVADAA